MKVLNRLRPGLDEKLYENALVIELKKRGHRIAQQRAFPVHYEGELVGMLVPDLIVDDLVVADPKVVTQFTDTHIAQVTGYLAITNLQLALLINFKFDRLCLETGGSHPPGCTAYLTGTCHAGFDHPPYPRYPRSKMSMKKSLLETLRERPLVGDGAMGTQLMLAGLEQGGCGEAWNLTHPDRVLAIQRRYVEAGADCLITNTFGGSRLMLRRHGHEGEVAELNRAASRIAREAFGDRAGFVLGDVGPLGALLEPYGDLSAADAQAALEEQCAALVSAGVDAIIIETQTSLEELGIAIDAAKAANAPCVIASLAYDLSMDGTFYKTMMGVSPEDAAEFIEQRGGDIVALNCGTGMDMTGAAKVARQYRTRTSLPIMVQPNAGLPVLENLKAVYKQLPADMARAVPEVLQADVGIVGSCCGSAPEHTRAIRETVDAFTKARR